MDAYDQRLLYDLDALAEKLEKQAKPDPAAVALLGALNPALKAFAPAISEAGTKDHALVLRVRARLAELLKGDSGKKIGLWREHKYGTTLDPACVQFYCSICGGVQEDFTTNYCPHCGAGMAGVEREQKEANGK